MTNKAKLLFVIMSTISFAFLVLMSTQFAVGTASQLLSTVGNTLGPHLAPTLLPLAALAVSGLYLAFNQRRRP